MNRVILIGSYKREVSQARRAFFESMECRKNHTPTVAKMTQCCNFDTVLQKRHTILNDINLPNYNIGAVRRDLGMSKPDAHPYECVAKTTHPAKRLNSATYSIFPTKHVDGNQPWKPVLRTHGVKSICGIDRLNRYDIQDNGGVR